MNDWVDSPLFPFPWALLVAPAGLRAPWWSIARVWVTAGESGKEKEALQEGGGGRGVWKIPFLAVDSILSLTIL